MNEFLAVAILFVLAALRFLAPLIIILGVGYLMNRSCDRWEASIR
jgi:hypothetical protein